MHFKMWSAICFNLDQSEILSSGNGLRDDQFKTFQSKLIKKSLTLSIFPTGPLWFNLLPNDKIRRQSKLKASADDKIKPTRKQKSVLIRVENIVGKGENAGYQHFLLCPQCFQKVSISGLLKVGIVW